MHRMLVEDEHLKNGPIHVEDFLIDPRTNKVLKVYFEELNNWKN